ncbi:MAG: carboxymuconolactone decarboxylase family protein [Planctomycetota bacterium]
MDRRTKELIAVGASVTANCQPCFEYHVEKARQYGADEEDIREAVAVAQVVRKGAAGKMDRFVATALGDACAAENVAEDAPDKAGECGLK